MIILLTLITMVIILTIFIIVGLATAGASFIIIFGDVIVAIAIIALLIKRLINKRKEN